MIHRCDKMSDAFSRMGDVSILIETNFCLFEGAEQSLGNLTVLPRPRNLNPLTGERGDIGT